MKKITILLLTTLCFIPLAHAQFVEKTSTIAPGVPNVTVGLVSYADVDNDNDLDFLIAGEGAFQLWLNGTSGTSGTYQPSSLIPGLPSVYMRGDVSWADYDRDGDLDLLLCANGNTQIHQNGTTGTVGTFTDVTSTVAPGVPNLYIGTVTWADVDNDGDQDFMVVGDPTFIGNGIRVAMIWQNGTTGTSGTFTDQSATLIPGILATASPSIKFGDFDQDGDLDLFYQGTNDAGNGVTQLWRNGGIGTTGVFTNVTSTVAPGLSQNRNGSADWIDVNSDGYLDIVFSGYPSNLKIWLNTGLGTFTDQTATIGTSIQVYNDGDFHFGDADNDGDLDFLLEDPYAFLQLWSNSGSPLALTDVTGSKLSGTTAIGSGRISWADMDNDHDLDFIATGRVDGPPYPPTSLIWENGTTTANTAPGLPSDLQVLGGANDGDVILKWTAATDNNTPSKALGYNVRIGTAPGLSDVVAPNSDLATGYNRVVNKGNVLSGTQFLLSNLAAGTTYYWSVQAIDNSYEGGAFTTEQSFTVKSVQHITTSGNLTATYGDADVDPGATSDNNTIAIAYTSSNTTVATIRYNYNHRYAGRRCNLYACFKYLYVHRRKSRRYDYLSCTELCELY